MLTKNFFSKFSNDFRNLKIAQNTKTTSMAFSVYNPSEALEVNEYKRFFQLRVYGRPAVLTITKDNVSSYGLGSPYEEKSFDDIDEIVGYIFMNDESEILFFSSDNM
ncbi:hypothetical protein [Salinicoccus sp. CNSTN-B1]